MTTTINDVEAKEWLDSRDLQEALDDFNDVPEDQRDEEMFRVAEAIRDLRDSGITDWRFGALFIREDYFPEYAKEFADDIGAVPKDYGWPTYHIDWEAAARDLRTDFTSVEFLGYTYYVRG